MSIHRDVRLVGVVAGAIALLSMAACSSDDEGASGTGGNGETQCTDCRKPPNPPSAGIPGDGAGVFMAVRKWHLGDKTREGTPNPNAWKKLGYDLDGYKSTSTSTMHCKLEEGASDSVKADGDNGIDNSFGTNIIPILRGINQQFSEAIDENLAAGNFALIVGIEKLGMGSDYVDLPGALYFGASMGSEPAWDGNDVWPLYCDLMKDCKESGTSQLEGGNTSTVTFPNGYMTDRTWVSGPGSNLTITLVVGGVTFQLDILKAVMTAELSSDNEVGTNGVIAGILDTEQLVATMSQAAGRISSSLCDGDALEEVKKSIRRASDIMKDGTQDPNATCNGISLGWGIDLHAVKLGEVQDTTPATPDPCD